MNPQLEAVKHEGQHLLLVGRFGENKKSAFLYFSLKGRLTKVDCKIFLWKMSADIFWKNDK